MKSIQSVVEEKWRDEAKLMFARMMTCIEDEEMEEMMEYGLTFITDLLSKQREEILNRIRDHANQNTYEGEEAKVYKTTMTEVEALIQSNN